MAIRWPKGNAPQTYGLLMFLIHHVGNPSALLVTFHGPRAGGTTCGGGSDAAVATRAGAVTSIGGRRVGVGPSPVAGEGTPTQRGVAMRMRHVSVLLSVITVGSLSSPAQACDPATPPEVGQVVVLAVNGTGCPQGTVHPGLDENMRLSVRYSNFLVQTAPVTAQRRFCQLTVALTVPDGHTYSVASSKHQGVATLLGGMTAKVETSYYFQGSSQQLVRSGAVVGSGPWEVADSLVDGNGQSVAPWRPCTRQVSLNIKVALSLNTNGSSATSQVNLNGPDAGSEFTFATRPC
jgi:hypothetical protein